MSINKTAYLITIGEPDIDGIMADEFEETLIFVGRLIKRVNIFMLLNIMYYQIIIIFQSLFN